MEVSQLTGMVSVGTLLALTIVAVSILILRSVLPNEVPLPSSLRESIDSVSLRFSSQEDADKFDGIKELPLGGTSEEKEPLLVKEKNYGCNSF
ncbi:cationic amino acid transporter 2, vacuolar-like [Carex rostrata]